MWLVFALLSGAFYTASGLLSRYVLKGQKDAWAFSFYFSLVGALVSLPFMLVQSKLPISLGLWGVMGLVGILIVVQNFLAFKSTNTLEASVQGALTKFRLVWTFLLGVLILHEIFSLQKVIGTLLTIAAGLVIIRKFRTPKHLSGVLSAFLATVLYGVIIVLYKYLFSGFNAVTLTFFIFAIPTIFNLIVMPHAFSRVGNMLHDNFWGVLLACGLGAFANLALNQALLLGEVSKVVVIGEAFLVFTLVGEHLLLKEKENLSVKVIAMILAILGAILIRLS